MVEIELSYYSKRQNFETTTGLHCYECGGTSNRECSKSKDAGEIIKMENVVRCNSTANSCMTADRDYGETTAINKTKYKKGLN